MVACFERDLKESCEEAADFLRKKLVKWKKKKSLEGKPIYSGEREFVCEVYRLLIERNVSYRGTLFVDYFPDPKDRVARRLPDMVFDDRSNNKSVVEFKVVVDKRKKGPDRLWKKDKDGIKSDFEKMKMYKDSFKSKVIVVAYTGDPQDTNEKGLPVKDFQNEISKSFHKTNKVSVIVC